MKETVQTKLASYVIKGRQYEIGENFPSYTLSDMDKGIIPSGLTFHDLLWLTNKSETMLISLMDRLNIELNKAYSQNGMLYITLDGKAEVTNIRVEPVLSSEDLRLILNTISCTPDTTLKVMGKFTRKDIVRLFGLDEVTIMDRLTSLGLNIISDGSNHIETRHPKGHTYIDTNGDVVYAPMVVLLLIMFMETEVRFIRHYTLDDIRNFIKKHNYTSNEELQVLDTLFSLKDMKEKVTLGEIIQKCSLGDDILAKRVVMDNIISGCLSVNYIV